MRQPTLRRRTLAALLGLAALASQAQAAQPLQPEAVESLPYAALGEPPSVEAELRIQLSPGGALLAVNDVKTVWLYRRDTRQRIAVTPPVAPPRPFDAAAVSTLEGMAWAPDATLYAWVRLYGGSRQAYAADARGARGLVLQTPERWPDDNDPLAGRYPIPDADNAYDIRANARHVVWRQNRGHGSMALMTAAATGQPRELVRGGWELERAPFDAAASRVIYPGGQGVAVHPLAGGAAQAIAGTREGDLPMSFDAASRWLALYRPRGGCDQATAKDSGQPYLCLLRLPAVARSASAPAAAPDRAPAPGATAQPSFDCAKARSTTELLLCERAALAALDVELAGLYRQALDRGANPSALKQQQTDWLRQRDQACTAGRTLAQARELLAVDTCLREHYGARIRLLRNQVAPDIGLARLQGLPAATLQGTRFGQKGCDAAQALYAPDGKALGLEMDCSEAGQGRRFFLLDMEGRRAIAASPEIGPIDREAPAASRTGADMAWRGEFFTVSTTGPDFSGQAARSGEKLPLTFTSSLKPIPAGRGAGMPDSIRQQRAASRQAREAAQRLGDEGLIAGSALQLGEHLIWLSDQGRGNVILRMHRRGQMGTLDLQRGSWELLHLLHDDGHLIYPSDDGLMLLELASGRAHRIRQTAMADLPLAWNPATRELAWTSLRLCGITEGGNRLGLQLCTAVLDTPRP